MKMTKYSLSLIASSIVLSIVLMQCNAPATAEAQVTSQLDNSTLVATSEMEKHSGVTYINKPEATIVQKSKVSTIEIPKSINTETAEVTTFIKPIALMSADFTLKSVQATIKGTSTLHDWESKVTKMEGKGSFQLTDNVLGSIKDAEIKIAVRGIISEKGSKMDNKTYETFKSDKYPFIIYSFSDAVVKITASHDVSIETTGNLAMAGVSLPVSLMANGKELPNGDLQLSVFKKLNMTDFGMEPPVMFLGTIKVGNEIAVSFDFVLSEIKN